MKPSQDIFYTVKDNDGDDWTVRINFQIEELDDEVKFIAVDPAPTFWIEDVLLGSGQVPEEVLTFAEMIMEDKDSYLDAVKYYEESLTIQAGSDILPTIQPEGDVMEQELFLDTLNQMEQDYIITHISGDLFDDWNAKNLDEGERYAEHEIIARTMNTTKGQYNRYYGLTPQDEYYFEEGE